MEHKINEQYNYKLTELNQSLSVSVQNTECSL